MNLPKFANPHLLPQTTHTISRADLEAEDEGEPVHADISPDVDLEALSTLEHLVKRSLGDFQMDVNVEEDGHNERTKKRRKVNPERQKMIEDEAAGKKESEEAEGEAVIPFRLLSSTAPRNISLKPKPVPVIKPYEPIIEDNEDDARLRAERAALVAVDLTWLHQQSKSTYYPKHGENKRHTTLKANNTLLPSSPILVVEHPHSKHKPSHSSSFISERLPEKTKLPPHLLPVENFFVPIINVALDEPSSTDSQGKKRRHRRRGKSYLEPKPTPAFWRPLREWGGKSGGYGYGYTSSKPVFSELGLRRTYRRDKMTKATFLI
ncbi:hypothetical protein ABKN59_002394 [Abortiporus biennis]